MSYTIEELKEYLANNVDEIELIDSLGLTTDRLVELLHDEIYDKFDRLIDIYDLAKEEEDFE